MSKPRQTPIRKPQATLSDRGASPPPEDLLPRAAPRPAIWADGKQAPAFEAKAFAEAGMLLARETSGAALEYLSTEAAAGAARIETQDWRLDQRLGRMGRVLPTAPGVARSLDGFALRADAAKRLLYGQPDPKPKPDRKPDPKPTPTPVQTAPAAEPPPPPKPAPLAEAPGDPDLAAIRALLRDAAAQPPAPAAAPPRRPVTTPPVSWEIPPPLPPSRSETAPVLRRALDWSLVRVLAGSVLVFATPIGYGRALYRHLDGADLREIVEDCHRMRIN